MSIPPVGTAASAEERAGESARQRELDALKQELLSTNGRESNRVKLSSWRGKLTYQVDSTTPGLSQIWTLDLHLRGDVGDYRDQAGEKPVAHRKIISMAKDSKASVVASGMTTDTDCTIAWGLTVTPRGSANDGARAHRRRRDLLGGARRRPRPSVSGTSIFIARIFR